MTDHTVINLKEVEDMAPKYGMSPDMESHFARVPLELQQSGLSYYRVAPDYRLPFGHRHAEQEEVYLVLRGSARVKVEDEVVQLEPWDAVRISPNAAHGFEAGPEGADILAFGAPNTENGDIEMLQDWWRD